MISVKFSSLFLGAALGLALSACSGNKQPARNPIASDLILIPKTSGPELQKKVQLLGEVPSNVTSIKQQNSARVTLAKSEIFNRDFLYSIDLQYSSLGDAEMSLLLQSMAAEHSIVRFRKLDNRLQVQASTAHEFESDSNAPEKLVTEFEILKETPQTLTIEIRGASHLAQEFLKESKDDDLPVLNATWLRSAEFVPAENLILMETSAQMKDGKIASFMESLFPRENLVRSDLIPMSANPEENEMAARFRFLSTSEIFVGSAEDRKRTKFATRFDLNPQSEVQKWYVTHSVPDEYLDSIRAGVEGWNRYSQAMWGKDFIQFAGKLPANIKLGDPRFNVINWDNVADAGAAYESQGYDPITGIQSHSLIYLPLAWVNIGKTYWERGGLSGNDKRKLKRIQKFLGKRARCFSDPEFQLTLNSRMNPEEFGKALLRQTLFHEVGHALGLAHNFKASLAYDPADSTSPVTTSVMDYNQFADERKVYDGVTLSSGPLLEYDRQMMAVLYNEGRGIENSKRLPACEDDEADRVDGGADPLCVRYDLTNNPVQHSQNLFQLFTDSIAKVGRLNSFPASVDSFVADVLSGQIQSETEWKEKSAKLISGIRGLAQFYLISGAQSLSRSVRSNFKNLLTFGADTDLLGLNEKFLRLVTLDNIDRALNFTQLPTTSQQAIDAALQSARVAFTQSDFASGLSVDQVSAGILDLEKKFQALNQELNATSDGSILGRLHLGILSELKPEKNALLYFGTLDGTPIDMEARMAAILENFNHTLTAAQISARLDVLDSLYAPARFASLRAKLKLAAEAGLIQAQDADSRKEWRRLLDRF